MAKKLQVSGDIREGFHLLSMVSSFADYRISFFINNNLGIMLKKYADFVPEPDKTPFSWFYFYDTDLHIYYYLFANKSQGRNLIPELKQFDYLLFIKGSLPEDLYNEKAAKLRATQGIQAVFRQDIMKIKNTDLLLEVLELHELNEVIIPARGQKFHFKKP
jgi:hypothetical protein